MEDVCAVNHFIYIFFTLSYLILFKFVNVSFFSHSSNFLSINPFYDYID